MKLRNALWLFGVPAHENDTHVGGWLRHREIKEPNDFPSTGSSMTPAEACLFLEIPNVVMVCCDGMPSPFSQYADKYLYSFLPMERVWWSSIGSGGYRDGREEDYILAKRKEYPNLCGCYMDDPLCLFDKYPEESRYTMAKGFVSDLRKKLDASGEHIDIVVTWYPYISRGDDSDIYEEVDGIALYTWNSLDLEKLDNVMEEAKKKFPNKKIYLGAYLFDYDRSTPLTAEQMEFQCERGKKWLLDGTISGMIFVTNAVMAPGMQNDIRLRNWIKKNGDLEIPQ
ncbi:MAG: hypothetical protein E7665_04780 [Ruminococcaceae bacterium]|nr:hypothetical protein [Oscillospiraceae bacterium]